MVQKIDHLGIAVQSIAETRTFYKKFLGLPCEGEETVESQKVQTVFFAVGEVHIELLELLRWSSVQKKADIQQTDIKRYSQ